MEMNAAVIRKINVKSVLIEELQGNDIKISIQTKSDLVLRDINVIKTFPNARVSFSINTLDEDFRADMDNAVSIGAGFPL